MGTLVLTEKCDEMPIVWRLNYNELGELEYAYWQFGSKPEVLIGKVVKVTKRGFTIDSYTLNVGKTTFVLQRQHFDVMEVNE